MAIGASGYLIRHRLWATLIVVLAFALTACSSQDPKLAGLLADPIASYEAEGIELIRTWQEAQGQGMFGRPTYATVDRIYRIADQDQLLAVLQDAVSFAESEGWRMEEGITAPTIFVGEKQLPTGIAEIAITLGTGEVIDEADGSSTLNIHLKYRPVSEETTP